MKIINNLFFKQDVVQWWLVIAIVLSWISGGSIIISREYLGGNAFTEANIYGMFTTISEWFLIYQSLNFITKEFSNKTINMIRMSPLSWQNFLLMKGLNFLFISLVFALTAWLETVAYVLIYQKQYDLVGLLGRLVAANCLYAIFLFATNGLIGLWAKKIGKGLLVFLIGRTVLNLIFMGMSMNKVTDLLTDYIPFSYVQMSFSFAQFTWEEAGILLFWSVIMIGLLHQLLIKKGYQ